jgi:hypothetical protein
MNSKELSILAWAVDEAGDPAAKALWNAAFVDETSGVIPPATLTAASRALVSMESRLRGQIDDPRTSDDDALDAANDLDVVEAIQRGLQAA